MTTPHMSSNISPDVPQLAAWLAATDIDLLEFTSPAGKVSLRRAASTPNPALPAAMAETAHMPPTELVIKAGAPGHFLNVRPGRSAPLAEPGDAVAAGQMLGLIQVGALLLPVRAPSAGVLTARLAEPGALVGFGSSLVSITPSVGTQAS